MTKEEREKFNKLADFVMEDGGSFSDRLNALTIMRNMIIEDEKREELKNEN